MNSRTATLGLALAASIACAPHASAGINGGGRASGAITQFGSIFVDGIEYETTTSRIFVDDVLVTEAALRIGQVVTVDGFVNADQATGTAFEVHLESDVRGAITAVDPVSARVTVLGQTVRVSGSTLYAPVFAAGFGALRVGQVVEVSGLRDATGALVATYIDASGASDDRAVGTVSGFDAATSTFRIGALVVDFSSAGKFEGPITDGVVVEVKGPRSTTGRLSATSVEARAPGLGAPVGSQSAMQGYVTRTPVNGRLVVGTQVVAVNSATRYVDGNAAQLVAGSKVQVDGTVSADGTLVANEVTFQFDDIARTHGLLTDVDARRGTLAVNGLRVVVDAATRVEDRSQQRVRRFSLSNLGTGETVEVDGFEIVDERTLRAGRVQRVDPDSRTWIEGVAANVAPSGAFTLIDEPIHVSSSTVFLTIDGRRLTAAQFAAAAPGREVKVKGQWTGSAWLAGQAQFK